MRYLSLVRSCARRKLSRGLVPGLASLALATGPAQAFTANVTANFNVTAQVATACSVTAADLAFGTYDASASADTTAISTISVNCSLLTPYAISLNSGNNVSGTTRRMASGTSRLSYEIYRDPTMTGIFGTVAAALGLSGIGTGLAVPTAIYGKIPKNQSVSPGSYTDQITVTVDY